MVKKILVILPNNLGDVIMALPILEALKVKDSLSHITFFVEEGFEGGLVNSRYCDKIFLFPRKRVRDLTRSSQWQEGIKFLQDLIAELKSEQFSQVINLCQHSYISYIVSFLDNSELEGRQFLREGNHAVMDSWSQYLFAIPFAREFNMLHATDVYKRVAGVPFPRTQGVLEVGVDERRRMAEYIQAKQVDPNSRFVIFQPGAAYAAKQWTVENFIELGRCLINDGYRLIITGALAEIDLAAGIAQNLGSSCIVSAGELSFRETIVLADFCEICVTGDTALMHAASALKKRVFALFGPTNPVETGPYGEGHFVFSGRCISRPCFCFDCKTKLCMKSISPATVYSCIKGCNPQNSSCDIFRTVFDKDGVYHLQPYDLQSAPYFNYTGASMVRKCFEPEFTFEADREQLSILKEQTEDFNLRLIDLEKALSAFILEHNTEHIHQFEEIRLQINEKSGIVAFWNAVLNLRLNSIPLIDPLVSVSQSKEACRSTRFQIIKLLASI